MYKNVIREDWSMQLQTLIKRKNFWVILISVLIGLVTVVSVGVNYVEMKKEKARMEAIEKEKQRLKEYDENLDDILKTIITTSAFAEGMANEYANVWRNAVYEPTYRINGVSPKDFNEALSILRKHFEQKGSIKKAEDGVNLAKSQLEKLSNPPKEYKESYEVLIHLFQDFKSFVDLSTSPKGSLMTYPKEVRELSDKIVRGYDEVKLKSPKIKE